jgi:hypothetical protein
MNNKQTMDAPAVDLLYTRSGYKPKLVLVVPIKRDSNADIDVRQRCTISDEEYNTKFVSPLGGQIEPSLPEVFIPVEQRFESALINFDQLRRKYPIYGELIHCKLRLSVFECPNGWYDLLLPIANDYALRKTDSETIIEYAIDSWHKWWEQHVRDGGIPSSSHEGLLPAIESTLHIIDACISNH